MKWTDRVRNKLKDKNLTFNDLALRLGVTRPAVSQYLTGRREPTITQIKEIARMLDLSLSEMLGDDATFISDENQIKAAQIIKDIPDDQKEQALKVLESFLPKTD